MNTTANNHLSEEEIITAVVDTADLNRLQQQHLTGCSRCRSQIEALSGDLRIMAKIAEASSPAVKRPFRAPATERPGTGWVPFGRKWAAGVAVALACAVIGGLLWQSQLSNQRRQLAREMLEAEQLMRQVDRLVENPLPETVMSIGAEGVAGLDEDFFRFLIPSETGDEAISRIGKKGLLT